MPCSAREALGARRHPAVGVAHHALRDALGVDAGAFGQRALHQQLADADAKAAADQLGEQEAARRCRARPSRRATRAACSSGGRPRSGSRRSSTHSARPRSLVARRRRQHVRDGLGEVADRLVALVEQPVVDAGALAGERASSTSFGTTWRGLPPARKYTAQAASAGAALGEVALERLDLGVGRGGRVELGEEAREALHRCRRVPRRRPPQVSLPLRRPSRSTRRRRCRRTRSRRRSASRPCSLEPAHHHRLVAVGDDDALGAGGADRALQAGPVGVVARARSRGRPQRRRRAPRSCIQPLAKASLCSPKRRVQGEPCTDGGATTSARRSSALSVDLGDQLRRRQRDAGGAVGAVQRLDRAVHDDRPDRRVDAREHALRLAEAVAHQQARAAGLGVAAPPGVDRRRTPRPAAASGRSAGRRSTR